MSGYHLRGRARDRGLSGPGVLAEVRSWVFALAALDALAGPSAVAGGHALAGICEAHGLEDAVGVLDAWLSACD